MDSLVPIRFRTITPDVALTFDVFIQIGGRYILFVRKGDDIDHQRYKKLKSKKLKRLFILSEEESQYQAFLDNRLSKAISDDSQSSEQKAEITSSIASSSVEDMHENPQNKQTFLLLEKAAKGIVQIVGKKSDVLGQFMEKVGQSSADPVIKHALNVASLCACLGEALGLPDQDIADLSVAALLMDIAIVEMPKDQHELFFKKRDQITVDEWKIFSQHPQKGKEMLQGKDYVNANILELVFTHEELLSGTGFPQKLQKLTLEQGILGLCACFDRQVTFHGATYKEALDEVSINQLGNFDLKLIKKLGSVLKSQSLETLN